MPLNLGKSLRHIIIALSAVLASALGVWALREYHHAQLLETLEHPQLSYRHCDFHYHAAFTLSCFYYRTHPEGGFSLPLVRIAPRSIAAAQERELVVLVPGGPGQGGMTVGAEIEYWLNWLEEKELNVDFLLYDPRGTGAGKAPEGCENYFTALQTQLSLALPLEQEIPLLHAELVRCVPLYLQQLSHYLGSEKSAGFTVFSSQHQAQDIDGMTRALGYKNVHLWGVSYGTRVALVAAQYPQVKTLLLDSPYPFAYGRASDSYINFVESIALHQRVFAAKHPAESLSYRDILAAVKVRLENQPVVIRVSAGPQQEAINFVLSMPRFYELGMQVLYSPYLYDDYYTGLREFSRSGKVNQQLQSVVASFVSTMLDPSFNIMVYFATECVDNQPEANDSLAKLKARYPEFADYFHLAWQYDACPALGVSTTEFIHHLPYVDKPTLIVSGEFDPVTPRRWAEALQRSLGNARLMAIDGAGHGALFSAACDWSFYKSFMQTGSIAVDIECEGF